MLCHRLRLLPLPGVMLGILLWAVPVHAEQPRDWAIGLRPEGTTMNLDVVVPGVQVAVEHRKRFYGKANELLLRSELTVAYPLTELRLDADFRLLFLTLGVSGGARDTYVDLRLGDRPLISRAERGRIAGKANAGNALWAWGEARVRLSLPFNDYVVFDNINIFNSDGRHNGTFDYRRGIVHDGDFFRSTTWLWLHHPDAGGIAPIFEVVNYLLDHRRRTLLNIGISLVTRPGLFRRNDAALVEIIANPWSDHYGTHFVDLPIVTSIGYRLVLDLPSTTIDEDAPSYFDSF